MHSAARSGRPVSAYWYLCGPAPGIRAAARHAGRLAASQVEELPDLSGQGHDAQARITFVPVSLGHLPQAMGVLRERRCSEEVSLIEALGTPTAPIRSWEIISRGEFVLIYLCRTPEQFVDDARERVARLAEAVGRVLGSG